MSCSSQKRIAIVYPLEFGEVGVKQRVKYILSYKKPTFLIWLLSFFALVVCGVCFLTDSPQEYRVMLPTDINTTQVQMHEKEIELEQILMDYDKDNITKVSIVLHGNDSEETYANILVVSKEIPNDDKQNEITTFASEYLNLETYNIHVEYIDDEMFSLR